MPKRSGFQAMAEAKCPRCREGDMFPYRLTNIRKFTVTNSRCNVCGLDFEIEPGFFQGAMYVSYAFSIAIITAVGISLNLFVKDPPIWAYIILILVLLILFLPVIFRYSRVIFLHLFGGIKYSGNR